MEHICYIHRCNLGGCEGKMPPLPPPPNIFFYLVKNINIFKTIWVVKGQKKGKPLRFTGSRIEARSILPSPTPLRTP